MEKKYIYKNRIVTADLPDGYAVSNKLEDNTSIHVELSDEQVAFLEANPEASMMEVWNMEIRVPIVPEPINEQALKEMMFNSDLCLDDLFEQFHSKIITNTEFAARNASIIELIKRKGFKGLNEVSKELKQIGILDETEYQTFLSIFSKQNIDITTY